MECELLCGMWAVVGHVGCCMVCVLLYGICAAGYVGCCICGLIKECGLLQNMLSLVSYVRCSVVCDLFYYM